MNTQVASELFDIDPILCDLARLNRSKTPEPKDIARWYSKVDFDALWMDITCMCARIGAGTDYAGTPAALVPRLKGLSRYILTLNSGSTAALFALGELLESTGIPMTLLRDTALALGYPQLPRFPIWHTQAAIPRERMAEVAWLANEAGFSVTARDGLLEITRSGRETVLLFPCEAYQEANATPAPAPAGRFLLPRPEAILVDLAQELCGILQQKSNRTRLHSRLILGCQLLDLGADPGIAFSLAREQGCAAQLQLLLEGAASLCGENRFERLLPPERMDSLGKALLELRNLKPGYNRLHRMWLYACVEGADTPGGTRKAFLRRLRNAVKKRLF